MNKRLFWLILIVLLLLCGCTAENDVSSKDYEDDHFHTESYYEDRIGEYQTEIEQYREELSECEELLSDYYEIINYYENLCDMYGYHTYESIYYPELWCNYVPKDDTVYHNDWLCPNFNNQGNYLATANPEFYENYEGYELCNTCAQTKICYLDIDEGIVHSRKDHLDLGTEDYVYRNVNYRFVSAQRAVEEGFSLCDSCVFN